MQLDPAEKRSVWWKGALKSGLKETLRGLVIGLVAAGVIFGFAYAVGMASGVGAMLAPMVTAGGSFNPAILMAFCSVISGVTGLFTGGSQAVEAYHQRKHNTRDEAKLMELDGRTRALEHSATAPSRGVQKILEAGPRSNYRDAALAEEASAPTAPTRG